MLVFMASLMKMGCDMGGAQIDPGYLRIAGQYDSDGDLAEDILQGEIQGYSNRYISKCDFLADTSRLNKVASDRQMYSSSLKGLELEYRPVRVSLYRSRKFGGKLMLGCYVLFKTTDEYAQNPTKDR